MYDTLDYLLMQERAGISSAEKEIKDRMQHRKEICKGIMNDKHIVYFKTRELDKKIEEIESIYSKVTLGRRVKESIVIDAYNSATIEGARTTVQNVIKAFNNPKGKDEKMVVNTVKGMQMVYSQGISERNIREIWEVTVDGVCENMGVMGEKYRSGNVFIGNEERIVYEPPEYSKVPDMMHNLFNYIENEGDNIWIKASAVQFVFVFIHPFCDGNGRIGRMLTQYVLSRYGKEKIKAVQISKNINENLASYYKTLRESEKEYGRKERFIDITPFIDYMLDVIKRAIVEASVGYNELSTTQMKILEKMKKHGIGSEITVRKAMQITRLRYGRTLEILNKLCRLGYLDKRVEHRKNIYRMK